jgi:hypothetical protein
MAGCKDEIITNNIVYENSDLTNPSIMPEVIFTLPANNAAGPFQVYNTGDGSSLPHFVVQFNKLISRFAFSPGVVTIEGFDDSVIVDLDHFIFPYPERSSSDGEYSDVFGFVINWAERYGHASYEIGRTYSVTIHTTLEDINRNHPVAPYTFSFSPEPFLRVVGLRPDSGSTDLRVLDTFLNLTFNSILSSAALGAITLDPPLAGRWQFLSYDSTEIFFSADYYPAFNTSYTLIVPAGTADEFGNTLPVEFRSSFATSPFEVSEIYPEDGFLSLNGAISVYLSGPIDTTTIRSAFNISPPVPGTFQIGTSDFYFWPGEPLRASTQYMITVSNTLAAWDGTLLPIQVNAVFTTEPFRVTWVSPSDGAKGVYRETVVSANTNLPLDPQTAEDAISISPPIPGSVEYQDGSFTIFYFPDTLLESYQLYVVTIGTALRSSEGDALEAPLSFSFTTGP